VLDFEKTSPAQYLLKQTRHHGRTSMKIHGTDIEATHPWPERWVVQGADFTSWETAGGMVFRQAFVEAITVGMAVHAKGNTIPEAENAAWDKYEALLVSRASCTCGHCTPEEHT
jgi:hypothetical protein